MSWGAVLSCRQGGGAGALVAAHLLEAQAALPPAKAQAERRCRGAAAQSLAHLMLRYTRF